MESTQKMKKLSNGVLGLMIFGYGFLILGIIESVLTLTMPHTKDPLLGPNYIFMGMIGVVTGNALKEIKNQLIEIRQKLNM